MKVFRFDDVCGNSDFKLLYGITDLLQEKFPDARVIYAISPLLATDKDQRVFPKIWNAYSDYRKHYDVNTANIPPINRIYVEKASHGLVHQDHRLLEYSAQEMSILISCSLIGAKIFVPPFNKWNADTEKICTDNNIELIKFEAGWLCGEYERFKKDHNLWYFHAREFTLEGFTEWLQ
jgi:hypothetical protein